MIAIEEWRTADPGDEKAGAIPAARSRSEVESPMLKCNYTGAVPQPASTEHPRDSLTPGKNSSATMCFPGTSNAPDSRGSALRRQHRCGLCHLRGQLPGLC